MLPAPSAPRLAAHATRLLSLAAATLLLSASAATAATTMTATDPTGDAGAAGKPLDLVSVTAVSDPGAGTLEYTIETVATTVGVRGGVFLLAGTVSGSTCAPDPTLGAAFGGTVIWAPPFDVSDWGMAGSDSDPRKLAVTRSGTKLVVTAGPDPELKDRQFGCVSVMTKGLDAEEMAIEGDELVAFVAAGGGTGDGSTPTKPQVRVTTDQPDADRDGVADATDACLQVAGAGATGCPTMSDALALRLGAKRVAVDKLVARTGTDCPATVRATIRSKGKVIGTGTLTVARHGSYCRVTGVVRLKRRAAKVRFVAKGTGMGGIAKSLKR